MMLTSIQIGLISTDSFVRLASQAVMNNYDIYLNITGIVQFLNNFFESEIGNLVMMDLRYPLGVFTDNFHIIRRGEPDEISFFTIFATRHLHG